MSIGNKGNRMARGTNGNKGRGKIFFEQYGKFASRGREQEYHKEWQFARRSKVIIKFFVQTATI